MLRHLRNLVVYGGLIVAVLMTVFFAGFLQEFARDDLREKIAAAGLTLPLKDPWLEVSLQHMTLTLMDGDLAIKRYDIGFGRGTAGRLVPDEASTPLGEYLILRKEKREDVLGRGSRFLVMDFPSPLDARRAYEAGIIEWSDLDRILQAHRLGNVPPADTPLGGPLGIQGNFFFFLDRQFTDGSIALSNADLNELYEYVTVGTRIVIKTD